MIHSVGYEPIGAMCYMMAVICVLYCQDSFYRLNATLSAIFLVVGVQQLMMPSIKKRGEVEQTEADVELMDRVRRLKEDMIASEMEKADACAASLLQWAMLTNSNRADHLARDPEQSIHDKQKYRIENDQSEMKSCSVLIFLLTEQKNRT